MPEGEESRSLLETLQSVPGESNQQRRAGPSAVSSAHCDWTKAAMPFPSVTGYTGPSRTPPPPPHALHRVPPTALRIDRCGCRAPQEVHCKRWAWPRPAQVRHWCFVRPGRKHGRCLRPEGRNKRVGLQWCLDRVRPPAIPRPDPFCSLRRRKLHSGEHFEQDASEFQSPALNY